MTKRSRPASEATSGAPGEYTIDDLAAETGVPSRTIRFYQAKGALPAPKRRGRVAFYNDEHVERLKLVSHLQDRGLNLRAIRDLFARSDAGEVSVSEWLGVRDHLSAPWTDDRARLFTESELSEHLGSALRPGLIAELVRTELVRRQEGDFFVPSPKLLHMGLRLHAAGVGFDTAKAAHDILRRRIGQAADELSDYLFERASQENATPDAIVRSLSELRELGGEAVRLVFAQEVERSLREAVQQRGGLPRRRRGGKPARSD